MLVSCILGKEEYYPGDLLEATITVKNLAKIPLEVDLISAQLHGDYYLTKAVPEQLHYHTIKRPPIHTSLPDVVDLGFLRYYPLFIFIQLLYLGSRGISLYASQATIVECNYKFLPDSERKCLQFS